LQPRKRLFSRFNILQSGFTALPNGSRLAFSTLQPLYQTERPTLQPLQPLCEPERAVYVVPNQTLVVIFRKHAKCFK
jgi:hypothetical protein